MVSRLPFLRTNNMLMPYEFTSVVWFWVEVHQFHTSSRIEIHKHFNVSLRCNFSLDVAQIPHGFIENYWITGFGLFSLWFNFTEKSCLISFGLVRFWWGSFSYISQIPETHPYVCISGCWINQIIFHAMLCYEHLNFYISFISHDLSDPTD